MTARVLYRGKIYEVAQKGYLGRSDLYALRSRYSGGADFPALVSDCRKVDA